MAETGNWFTPQVNGLPRFDKPPLVYWLMGLGYSIPGNVSWDPLEPGLQDFLLHYQQFCLMLVLGTQ